MIAPVMLLVGFAPNVVVATQKAGGMGVNIGAMSKFYKQKGLVQWKQGAILSVLAVFAAYIGTRVVFWFSEDQIKTLIAGATLIAIPFFLRNKEAGVEHKEVTKGSKVFGTGLYGMILTIQAGIGSGVGSLNMFVLMGPLGFTALEANATKRLVGTVINTSSFLFFIGSGYVDWKLAGIGFVATLIGGRLGATIAIDKGSVFVKKVFVGVILLVITLLLLDI